MTHEELEKLRQFLITKGISTLRVYQLLARRCKLRAEIAKLNVDSQWHIRWMKGYEKYRNLAKELERGS